MLVDILKSEIQRTSKVSSRSFMLADSLKQVKNDSG